MYDRGKSGQVTLDTMARAWGLVVYLRPLLVYGNAPYVLDLRISLIGPNTLDSGSFKQLIASPGRTYTEFPLRDLTCLSAS